MNFSNPHYPFIRVLYGMAIGILQWLFFLGYLVVCYYFLKYGYDFGLGPALDALEDFTGWASINLWGWLFITFLYALCFAFLGTLSAIASAEHSLHLLANKIEASLEILPRERFHVSISYYFNAVYIEDGEIEFNAKFGTHRCHLTTGFMIIKGKSLQQRKIGNFWGVFGRKKIDFFQFSKGASVKFIQPIDLSKLRHNTDGTIDQWVSTQVDDFAGAHLDVLVDGRFIKSLKKLFPDQSAAAVGGNQYATIDISGEYFSDAHHANNIRVSGLSVQDWLRYTRRELQDVFLKDEDIPDAMKTKIKSAMDF
jgi:hypothetical protein